MALVNRNILKDYFRSGKKPTEQQFSDLIDSVPNLKEDASTLRKDENGLRLYPAEGEKSVIQFFSGPEEGEDLNNKSPLWKITLNEDRSLCVSDTAGRDIIQIKQDSSVQINGNLDVHGCISAASHNGLYGLDHPGRYMYAPADGKWHTIRLEPSGYMQGCRIYHIVAGCGGEGKYALLEATAMICYTESPRIRRLGSWTGFRFSQIKLRWDYENDSAALQIKAKKRKGENAMIHYRVTELWNDYYMEEK